jgi:hypothetical protein
MLAKNLGAGLHHLWRDFLLDIILRAGLSRMV